MGGAWGEVSLSTQTVSATSPRQGITGFILEGQSDQGLQSKLEDDLGTHLLCKKFSIK